MHWIAKIGIAAFMIATPIKWVANGLGDKLNYDPPCTSSLEARLWRIYVCRAHLAPNKLTYHDQEIEIKEAWIERRSKTRYFLVWLPYKKDMGSYHLCFTLKKGGEMFRSWPQPLWVVGDARHSIGQVSSKDWLVFHEKIEQLPQSLKASLIASFEQQRPKDIEITIER